VLTAALPALDATGLDLQAFALAAALPAVPFGLYLVVKGIGGDKTQGVLLAIILLVILTANFRTRAFDDKDVDFQVALRLLAIAGMYVMVLPFLRKVIRRANKAVLSSWLCFFAYMMLTSGYAIDPGPAIVATASLLGAFLFVSCLCIQHGADRTTWVVGTAASILFLTSLCVYLAVPSFGRMSDWVGNDYVVTARLQGVLGSSNGAGMASAAGLFLIMTFFPSHPVLARVWKYVGALSALLCLLLSQNRMALFALVASAMTFYILKGPIARNALAVFAIALFAASCVVLFADDLVALVARSANEAEILTLTGRTRIWAVVIDLWERSPLFGYGFGSALYILPVHPDLFRAAAHSHNLYLEQLFSGGLIGIVLFGTSMVISITAAWRIGAARELSLMIFFLIYGMTEPVIYGPVSFPVIIMILAIARILSQSLQREVADPIKSRRIAPRR
jgi:O-antigen ligase